MTHDHATHRTPPTPRLSRPMNAQHEVRGGVFSVHQLGRAMSGYLASPVVNVDHYRMSGRVFAPHPHAGFSAVTYLFESSPGGLRSRDSLGHDILVEPGALLWTLAGRGMMHEVVPAADGRTAHGIQIAVNLSAENKMAPPRVDLLERSRIPAWQGDRGDRVRAVVGSYRGVSSPLVPIEPFHLLDADLRSRVSFDVPAGWNALVLVTSGALTLAAEGERVAAGEDAGVAIQGGGEVWMEAGAPARAIVLAGRAIDDPVMQDGPFIMRDADQIRDAVRRYEAGEMGRIDALPSP